MFALRAGLQSGLRAWIPVRMRTFSTNEHRLINPLLNLSGMAFAKEAQYFSKERKIPREEFHPILELIRSSEVDPFAPAAGASPIVIAALRRAQRGESDLKSAYDLLLSNLIAQLETSRKETKELSSAFSKLQDKHRSQERHALVLVLAIVTFLSVNFFKPDALDIIGRDIEAFRQDCKNFDWQWLGNPPAYRTQAGSNSTSNASIPTQSSLGLSNSSSGGDLLLRGASMPAPSTQLPTTSRTSTWSKLFWASDAINPQ